VQADLSVRGSGFEQVLILVDGVRIKDAQTGHHAADIPVALDDIARVEVLRGTGSSLYGADAVGGTINIVTRRPGGHGSASFAVGQHGLIDGSIRAGVDRGRFRQSFAVWGSRSSGFAPNRDHRTIGLSTQIGLGDRTRVLVAHLSKAFGADGFYGPSPSYEWTGQTLAVLEHTSGRSSGWQPAFQVAYRTHADEFLWDVRRPEGFRSRHRTHAVAGTARGVRAFGPSTRLAVGVGTAADWIRSTTLGNHAVVRGAAFAELQRAVGSRTVVYPGLRVDAYSVGGDAWSPSLSAVIQVTPTLRARASVGRAFRVPTFTERYYRDPNHVASSQLASERAWGAEVGAAWTPTADWSADVAAFMRRERDVIDWVRPGQDDQWRSTNVRRVAVDGLELTLRRSFSAAGQVAVNAAITSVDPEGLALASKYVLDFVRQSAGVSGWFVPVAGLTVAPRVQFTRRDDGRRYWTADLRLTRAIGPMTAFVEATNLSGVRYQAVRGIDMPGRWISAGVKVPVF
jgi:iron complex outermembrane receptor protein